MDMELARKCFELGIVVFISALWGALFVLYLDQDKPRRMLPCLILTPIAFIVPGLFVLGIL